MSRWALEGGRAAVARAALECDDEQLLRLAEQVMSWRYFSPMHLADLAADENGGPRSVRDLVRAVLEHGTLPAWICPRCEEAGFDAAFSQWVLRPGAERERQYCDQCAWSFDGEADDDAVADGLSRPTRLLAAAAPTLSREALAAIDRIVTATAEVPPRGPSACD